MKARKIATLRELVEAWCPRRKLKMGSVILINAIVAECERWPAIKAQAGAEVKAHRQKLRRLVPIADHLKGAATKAEAALRSVDADKELERELDRLRTLGIKGTRETPFPMGGAPATVNLYVRVRETLESLRQWEHFWRPRKGAPQKASAVLLVNLRYVCQLAGCTNYERTALLETLSESHGLPKLSTATLRRRAERAKKKAATK